MKKSELKKMLGGTDEKAAKALGYTHRNNIQRLPEEITGRQLQNIEIRLKAFGYLPVK